MTAALRAERHDVSAIAGDAMLNEAATTGTAVSFTCVPPGNGTRIGVGRNVDGVHDASE